MKRRTETTRFKIHKTTGNKEIDNDDPMNSDPERQEGLLPAMPPSRAASRRRTTDLSESQAAVAALVATTPVRQAKRGVSWSHDPLVPSPPVDDSLLRLLETKEQRQDGEMENSETGSLRIQHDAIEVTMSVLDVVGMDPKLARSPTISTCPIGSSGSNSSPQDQSFPSTPTMSDLEPSTRLHSICDLSRAGDILKQAPQHLSATNAAALDAFGRTPLHILSTNASLGTFGDAQMVRFVVDTVWKAHPSAMTTQDSTGKVPFQAVLQEWTNDMLLPNKDVKDSSSRANVMSRSMLWNMMKTPPKQGKQPPSTPIIPNAKDSISRQKSQLASPSQQDLERGRLFSSPVLKKLVSYHQGPVDDTMPTQLTRKATVALNILSAILDEANNTGESDIALKMVEHIASTTPLLIKSILLLDDIHEREWALKSRIVHAVLTSKYSVGRWLTDMLQSSNRLVSDAALDYLRLVSNSDLFDPDVGLNHGGIKGAAGTVGATLKRNSHSKRQLLSNDTNASTTQQHDQQKELYSAVSRLPGFVPSLLSLSYLQIEEAATTNLVQLVLDNHISRPFAAMVVLCDAVFLLLLIIGFRAAVNRLLLGYGSHAVMKWLYVANTGIFYFIIRELGKAVSLCMITRRARIYFYSFWNISDLLTTLLSMISVVSIRGYMTTNHFEAGDDVVSSLRFLYAITTGFLWLRVLSFLKAINMQLATFVLAILQITRDVMWFSFILFCLVICFGQMFFTLLVPPTCDAVSGEQICTQSEYYLKVYAILLGDFGAFAREDFSSVFSVFLLVLFSFMVVLVLLNVLIAVASDSYEKCLLKSRQLFGRARVMLIAELVSFQNLLKWSGNQTPGEVYKQWWSHYSSWGWSRGSMIFFGLSSLVVLVWVIAETSGVFSNAGSSNVWMSLLSIFVIVSLFVGIMLFLASGADKAHDRLDQVLEDWEGGFVKRIIIRVLGGSLTGEAFEKQNQSASDEAWQGRLMYLRHEMNRIAEENRSELREHMHSIEKLVRQTETRLQGKFELVKD